MVSGLFFKCYHCQIFDDGILNIIIIIIIIQRL